MWPNLHVYKFPLADSWNVKEVLGGKQEWKQGDLYVGHWGDPGEQDGGLNLGARVTVEGWKEKQDIFQKWN